MNKRKYKTFNEAAEAFAKSTEELLEVVRKSIENTAIEAILTAKEYVDEVKDKRK